MFFVPFHVGSTVSLHVCLLFLVLSVFIQVYTRVCKGVYEFASVVFFKAYT